MANEKILSEKSIIGDKASKVLSNDAYVYATSKKRAEIYEKLATTAVTRDNERNILAMVRDLQSLDKIQSELEKIMMDGKHATAKIIDMKDNPNKYKVV